MSTNENNNNVWSWEQNKAFECGLVIFPENCEGRWNKISAAIPGYKSAEDCMLHYQVLVDDIAAIEAGFVELPSYVDTNFLSRKDKGNKSEWETRKGQPWTEEEHKQFLLGMQKYGKGDWKSIAKYCVKTRTATQVASHAQKHFKRQFKSKDTKRWSIFDITAPSYKEDHANNGGSSSSSSKNDTSEKKKIEMTMSNAKEKIDSGQETFLPFEGLDFDANILISAHLDCLAELPPL